MVEQKKKAESRLFKADLLPICNMENDCMMIGQDVEVSWIAGITFSKRGSGVKIWQKLHF